MAEHNIQTPSDITINSIVIRKPTGTKLQIIPAPEKDDVIEPLFTYLNINESIFQSGINGTLKFKEPNSIGDYFNILGNEFVDIDFESPHVDDSNHKLTFCINDVRFLGDETLESVAGPSSRPGAGWEIEFISCESYLLNWDNLDYMDEDFIGKIAGDDGLVDSLADKYFNPDATEFSHSQNEMEIEPTDNSIWLKKNQNMYPWGKDVHPPDLMTLMNNLTENSVTTPKEEGGDSFGVNYLFYADLDGWHFKSIRKMIADSQTSFFGLIGGPREYRIADPDSPEEEWGDGGSPRIEKHAMISEYDHLKLFKGGAYSSYYERIKPSYEDPYFDYLDFTSQHTHPLSTSWGGKEIIDYSYHRDADRWGSRDDGGRVEEFKLIPESIDTEINIEDPINIDRKSVRKYDKTGLYGYFDSPFNYYNDKPHDFLGSVALQGKQGKRNDILWQTMFDQTDLKGDIIKIIQKDIKEPTSEKYREHIQLLNLKEKFNVYRHSICCDKTEIKKFVFLALIDDAKKISENDRGGIYEYSWKEIEMWPREHINQDEGTEASPPESPLKIVIPTDGMKGKIKEDSDEEWSNPAYNINELMNTTDGTNVLVGPGINVADLEYNDYPESYQMMPVGGYFEVEEGEDMLVDPCATEPNDDDIEDGPWTHRGQIVQMYRIPNYILGALNEDGEVVRGAIVPNEEDPTEDPDPTIPKDIYFFDVTNAHDGLCGCLS